MVRERREWMRFLFTTREGWGYLWVLAFWVVVFSLLIGACAPGPYIEGSPAPRVVPPVYRAMPGGGLESSMYTIPDTSQSQVGARW